MPDLSKTITFKWNKIFLFIFQQKDSYGLINKVIFKFICKYGIIGIALESTI